MNLYYKVEAAFDGMADALKAAMNIAEDSEETMLYSDLADDLADLRDDTQSLHEKLIQKKNAASAVAAVETAKESDKHSDLSIDKILENVKGAYLIVELFDGKKPVVHSKIRNKHDVIEMYSAAVETFMEKGAENLVFPEEMVEAHKKGANRSLLKMADKVQQILEDIVKGERK